ncbi:hypothetical protein [Geodermatophilus obscurus]|uniref:hypothetical protein n=1 Tax=Geodermatophilus obscurus TaxID=1861 RepID=UPI0011409744|nr:hypothetical protein [Geodermatophilus obscurus]
MANTWPWWVALVAAVPMLAAPLLVMIRRSGRRQVRFTGRPSVSVPSWAHLLGLAGIASGLAAVDRLSSTREDGWLYGGGVLLAQLVLTTGLVIGHNRRVAADPGDAREGVRTRPAAGG